MSTVSLDNFDEQEAHVRQLLTWLNSYKNLSMHFILLVAIFCQFILLVAIETNQIQRFGLNVHIL